MPAHLGRRGERAGRAEGVGRVADRGEPRLPGPAAEHRAGHHQDGSVAGGVEGEAAERDRPGAGHGDLVLDRGAVEQLSQPLLAGREPVLARWQRDPRRLAPASQPLAMADPGQRGGPGKPAHRAARVGDGARAHHQPVRYRLALVTAAGFHACQLYVAIGATRVPGTCLVTAPPGPGARPGVAAAAVLGSRDPIPINTIRIEGLISWCRMRPLEQGELDRGLAAGPREAGLAPPAGGRAAAERRPALAGPALAGPALAGPVLAGPVLADPVTPGQLPDLLGHPLLVGL